MFRQTLSVQRLVIILFIKQSSLGHDHGSLLLTAITHLGCRKLKTHIEPLCFYFIHTHVIYNTDTLI
uniref:Uncharacterized protein n=1 Tax=Oryctes rhinoceros nudivirus TaxID=92521 RepID=A3QU02_9VIRU|nr:unknown [Oryctes rhinoceros nudivirus]UBR58192.1 hypothetical protein [Oryctes rhinoceros nudivirus]UBR58325.1 hypothetical protein [Oryctes rhinoceros nudivirus]